MAGKPKKPLAGGAVLSPDGETKPEKSLNYERFAREYYDHGNATLAYRKAFPEAAYNTARVEGCKLLAKPNMQEMIRDLKEADASVLNFTREKALALIKNIALKGDEDRTRLAALNDLWEKLGFNKAASEGDRSDVAREVFELFDGIGRNQVVGSRT